MNKIQNMKRNRTDSTNNNKNKNIQTDSTTGYSMYSNNNNINNRAIKTKSFPFNIFEHTINSRSTSGTSKSCNKLNDQKANNAEPKTGKLNQISNFYK
jgi:hypothetical protein